MDLIKTGQYQTGTRKFGREGLLLIIHLAKEDGFQGFTADVLSSNIEMMKFFSKGGHKTSAKLENGLYKATTHFEN